MYCGWQVEKLERGRREAGALGVAAVAWVEVWVEHSGGVGSPESGGTSVTVGAAVTCCVLFAWRAYRERHGCGAANRHLRSSQPRVGCARVPSSLQKEVCVAVVG